LPIILLWILSIPIRYFFCIILSLTNIPIYGLIANLFPPSTLLCSVCSGQPNNCYSNCPACQNYNECIGLPSIYTNFCLQANQYFSILNTIFCLIGYVMATILLPITEFINLILAFTGYQICLYTNPDNCFPGEYQCNDLQYGIGSPR
jgi:hypothetical protein